MQTSMFKKILVSSLFLVLLVVYLSTDLGSYLTLANLKQNQSLLAAEFARDPVFLGIVFGLVYIFITALSIPGATILTLSAGAIFGIFYGTIIASFASTLGATLSLLATRYLFRKSAERRFGDRMNSINEGLRKEGSFYLFTLRAYPKTPAALKAMMADTRWRQAS